MMDAIFSATAIRFSWPDYLVLALVLLIPVVTGIVTALQARRYQSSVQGFLMAGGDMPVFPVACSLYVSMISGLSLTTDAIMCYRYGFVFVFLIIGYAVGTIPAAIIAPKFHKLRIISAYAYIETRYSRGLRLFCSLMFTIMVAIWMGGAAYSASLALNQASAIPMWGCILLINGVCTFYTTIGGMKTVIWTDFIQFAIMIIGQLTIFIIGTMQVGGIHEVWRIADEGGRLNFAEEATNFNLYSDSSFHNYFVGGLFGTFCVYVSAQQFIQRFSTVSTGRKAAYVSLWTFPMYITMSGLIVLNGLVMFALYHDCDPVEEGRLTKRDQMVPLLVMDLLSKLPGTPGLHVGVVLSATLSSLSSAMNSMAANAMEDLILPIHFKIKGITMGELARATLAKALVFAFGIIICILSFLPMISADSLFTLNWKVYGIVCGPTSGLFILGICWPKIHKRDISVGYVLSMLVLTAVAIGSIVAPARGPIDDLPLSTDGCPTNTTIFNSTFYDNGMSHKGMYNIKISSGLNGTLIELHQPANTTHPSSKPPFNISEFYYLHVVLYNAVGLVIFFAVTGLLHAITLYRTRHLEKNRSHENVPMTGEYKQGLVDKEGFEDGGKALECKLLNPKAV